MYERMGEFLSEEGILYHKEYYRNLKCKLSILEKSESALKGKAIDELHKLRIPRYIKEEAIILKEEILLHEKYFSSFGNPNKFGEKLKKQFGTFENFAFEAFMFSKEVKNGFLIISSNGKRVCFSNQARCFDEIKLVIDLCEHAYFLDYKFDREQYVKNAISRFDVSKV